MADSLTILLNVPRSKANRIADPLDYIYAALGALYNRANSPNISPAAYY